MPDYVNILSDPQVTVRLEAGSEIPFGPTLFSLYINQAPHKLEKYLFLENHALSDSNTYLALVSYVKEKQTFFTQLILVDLVNVQYAIIDKYNGAIHPQRLSDGILTFERTASGVTTLLEFAISEITNWQPLVEHDKPGSLSLKQLLGKYGYHLSFDNKGEPRVKAVIPKKLLFSLIFTGAIALAVLFFSISSDQGSSSPEYIVAVIIGTILLSVTLLVVLNKLIFELTINSSGINIRSPFKYCCSVQEVKGFNIKEEISYKYRSSEIESYTFYIMLLLVSGRTIKLLHLNNTSKEEGLKDANEAVKLLRAYLR